MKQNPNPDDLKWSFQKEEDQICPNSIIGVEWVELNTASNGIKNWNGKQMVQIHQHGQDKHQISFLPFSLEKDEGDKEWNPKM